MNTTHAPVTLPMVLSPHGGPLACLAGDSEKPSATPPTVDYQPPKPGRGQFWFGLLLGLALGFIVGLVVVSMLYDGLLEILTPKLWPRWR